MKYAQILYKASKGTFGEVLGKKSGRNAISNFQKPPGFDILETKFANELNELNKFFQDELRNRQSKSLSTEAVKNLMEKYVTDGMPHRESKQLTLAQRKLLAAAYAKANKPLPKKSSVVNSVDRAKLGLLINRNWPYLKYISETNGVKLVDEEQSSWIVDGDEIGDVEEQAEIAQHKSEPKPETSMGNFTSLLKSLNKVHQTQIVHVLPTMTQFQASPTIRNVEIGEEEVKDIEHFLHQAKRTLDSREQDLFKAKINYELTTNMIQKHPKTFAHGNFFDPVCIPGTLVDLDEKQIAKIITKQSNLKKNSDNLEVMRVYLTEFGRIQVDTNIDTWDGNISNIYQIFRTLEKPHMFQSQLNKFLKTGWIPVTSNSTDMILVRDKREHHRVLIKRGTLVGIMGFFFAIGVLGINM